MEQVHQELGNSDPKNDTLGRPAGESALDIGIPLIGFQTYPFHRSLIRSVNNGLQLALPRS
jgi:hypothetical protein